MTGSPSEQKPTGAQKRIRKEFGSKSRVVDIPDLIGMQRTSFERFLQKDVPPESREDIAFIPFLNQFFPSKILPPLHPLNMFHTRLVRSSTQLKSASTGV